MPKYFCDYCDTYLTHDSPSVRKTHCAGRKHRENVKFYYEKWYEQNIQKVQQQHRSHIPPPGSLPARLDLPPPPMSGGLPTGPPPPMPSLANVMIPPPSMLNHHQPPMPIPNVMIPPPPARGTTLLPPPPAPGTTLLPPPPMSIPPPGVMPPSVPPPGMPTLLPPRPSLLKRD